MDDKRRWAVSLQKGRNRLHGRELYRPFSMGWTAGRSASQAKEMAA